MASDHHDDNGDTTMEHWVAGAAAPLLIREQRCRGLSFQVWPAASALCSYLEEKEGERVRGRSVLELGSGPGLVGLVAARLGAARVLLTDLPHAIPNLAFNTHANFPAQDGAVEVEVEAQVLRWGVAEDVAQLPQWSFDLVVASDVIYYDSLFQPLLHTLQWLVAQQRDNPPALLLAHTRRWTKDAKFFKMARKSFRVEAVATYPPPPGNKKPVVIYALTAVRQRL